MATTQHEITGYQLNHTTGNASNPVVIYCLSNITAMGMMYFHKSGSAIPVDSKAASGFMTLHFREQQFISIIETLRNEKPLYIWFSDTINIGGLKTTNEPIGEDEGM
jgi:hypothetical protein